MHNGSHCRCTHADDNESVRSAFHCQSHANSACAVRHLQGVMNVWNFFCLDPSCVRCLHGGGRRRLDSTLRLDRRRDGRRRNGSGTATAGPISSDSHCSANRGARSITRMQRRMTTRGQKCRDVRTLHCSLLLPPAPALPPACRRSQRRLAALERKDCDTLCPQAPAVRAARSALPATCAALFAVRYICCRAALSFFCHSSQPAPHRMRLQASNG